MTPTVKSGIALANFAITDWVISVDLINSRHVRFAPDSDQIADVPGCPVRAMRRLMQR